MKNSKARQQGLYRQSYEHDACGIGFVANIKGNRSNEILKQGLTVLDNLNHRGGVGSEPNSGDGAGILIQVPDAFCRKVCGSVGISLPPAGDFGTGLVFLPHDENLRTSFEARFEAIIAEEGQRFLGWRDVPLDPSDLGRTARQSMPYVRQLFIGREGADAGLAFERKLYVIRRRVENAIGETYTSETFYLPSLSSRTIVYKGMLTAPQLSVFFRDLQDEDMVSALALVHSRYSTNTFPSWERAHPNRYLIHNGEINTLRGNVNFMHARESLLESKTYGGRPAKGPACDQSARKRFGHVR